MSNIRYKKASSRISRRSQLKKTFGLFLKIAIPVAFLTGSVLLLRADFLQAVDFEVSGAEVVQLDKIKNSARDFISGNQFFLIPKSNLFLINKENLANVLLNQFNQLEKIEVDKQFLSKKVVLKIVERKADFFWCTIEDECFAMTRGGLIFESRENTEDKLVFKGRIDGSPLMKSFATPTEMESYLKFVTDFADAGFKVSVINFESADRAIAKTEIADTVSDIIFNPQEKDLSLVAKNTILLINETKNKNPSARFEYIDARFGNKFFYKLY